MTNTPAFYGTKLITAEKSFMRTDPVVTTVVRKPSGGNDGSLAVVTSCDVAEESVAFVR